ncbi:MAG: M28 family metallopeptidase [Dehalococcoidia bacterium]|nr:M28 family metallopeptidase [Dehalococcoidia bacterium]
MKRQIFGTPLLAVLLVAVLVMGGCVVPLGGSASPTPEPTATSTATATATAMATASPTATATATATRTPAPAPTASPTATAVPTPAPALSSGQRALQHVRYLAETIGSRPAGSAQERAAADYIETQLRSYGYAVERQNFPFPYFIDRGARLLVQAPQAEELHPLTMGLSAAGRVEAPIASVGLARPQDLPLEGLRGRIGLIQRGETTFDEKIAAVARAGAAGAIIFNNAPGNFRGRLSQLASIPVVSISQDEGNLLLELLKRGTVTVQFSVDATSEERRGQNIIATRRGTGAGTLVFGAHYDSVEAGPGANDNASGSAVVLELARLARPGPLTMRFIAFSAEELGLLGSLHYVSSLTQAERQQIVAMVSLDMVGVGDKMRFGGSQQLVQTALAIASSQGIPAQALEGLSAGSSDHVSFISAGIPAVLFHYTVGNDLDPNYHTAQDRAGFVDPANMEKMVEAGLAFAARLGEGR